MREHFIAGTEPTHTCALHESVAIDRRNGLRAGAGCDPAHVTLERFTRVPPRLERWASGRRWRRVPEEWSPFCPGAAPEGLAEVDLLFPLEGDRFAVDPARPRAAQAVSLRARVRGATRVTFEVDGEPVASASAPFEASWVPTAGAHRITARVAGAESSARVEVAD
jgi:hypothetical protein